MTKRLTIIILLVIAGIILSIFLLAENWLGSTTSLVPATIDTSSAQKYEQEVWWCPDQLADQPDSPPDYFDIYNQPDQWAEARGYVDVFAQYINFYGRFDTLVEQDALFKMTEMGLPFSLEAPVVKPHPSTACEVDRPILWTNERITELKSHGGIVRYIAMDEPIWGGRKTMEVDGKNYQCDYSVEETAAKVAKFIKGIRQVHPDVQIVQYEPWPTINRDDSQRYLDALQSHDVSISSWQMDTNWQVAEKSMSRDEIKNELRHLKSFVNDRNVKLGVLVTADFDFTNTNYATWPQTDQEYYDLSMELVRNFNETFKPDIINFISFYNKGIEDKMPPLPIYNLPDNRPNSFTKLIIDGSKVFGITPHDKGILLPTNEVDLAFVGIRDELFMENPYYRRNNQTIKWKWRSSEGDYVARVGYKIINYGPRKLKSTPHVCITAPASFTLTEHCKSAPLLGPDQKFEKFFNMYWDPAQGKPPAISGDVQLVVLNGPDDKDVDLRNNHVIFQVLR